MSDHTLRRDDMFLGQLRKNWPLLVALASVIAMAVSLKDRVDGHETRIVKIENIMDGMDSKMDKLIYELVDKKRTHHREID